MKATTFILLIIISWSKIISAQEMVFDWVDVWKESSGDNVYPERISSNKNGHVYIAGRLISDTDMDPGPGVAMINRPTTEESTVFAKFNTEGEFIWATAFHTSNIIRTESIVADTSGNLYVAGYFRDTIFTQMNGVDTAFVETGGSYDVFLAKIDPDGNLEWMKIFGDKYDDQINDLELDNEGNLYCLGYFAEYVQFEPGEPVEYSEYYDLCILKYSPDGTKQWLYRTDITGLTFRIYPKGIDIDVNGNVNIIGNYYVSSGDTLDFEYGPGESLAYANKTINIFIVQLDGTDGSFRWLKSFENTGSSDRAADIDSDTNGDLYFTGHSTLNQISFDNTSSAGDLDFGTSTGMYIVKLSDTGDFIWLQYIDANNSIIPYSIVTDHENNIIIQGTFTNDVTMETDQGTINHSSIPGASFDVFTFRFDQDKNYLWSHTYGTRSSDYGHEADVDQYGNIYGVAISGYVSTDTARFGNIDIVGIGGSNGVRYLYKLTPCSRERIEQFDDSTYYAEALNASYQWLDCNNGYSPMLNDTNRFFTPKVSGNYALQATNYVCMDTSECVYISREYFIAAIIVDTSCANSPTTFTDLSTTTGTGIIYEWDFDNDGLIDDNTVGGTTFTYDTAGTYQAKLVISNNEFDRDSIIYDVLVLNQPTIIAGADQEIEYGQSITILATSSSDVNSIIWSPSSTLDDNTVLNPLASPKTDTKYTIAVSNSENCSNSDSMGITVKMFIPTGFTPDGDGVNDYWEVPVLVEFASSTVEIFDRSGQRVFTGGAGNFWDGTYNGKEAATGAYYYIIVFGDGSEPISGNVNLIRLKK